jgi:ATP-dependent helicase/nuclease subunit B
MRRRYCGLNELDPLSSGPDAKWFGIARPQIPAGLAERGADLRSAFDAELVAFAPIPALDSLARAFLATAHRAVAALGGGARLGVTRRALAGRQRGQRDAGRRWHHAHGTADRVDQAADGTLAIVDYKTGAAPSAKSTGEGLNSQLGLLGLLAEDAGLGDLAPEPVGAFEYWELKRDRKKAVDGAVKAIKGQKPKPSTAAAVVERAREALAELSALYLLGQQAFVPGDTGKRYADFDQLMRRDEWFGRDDADGLANDGDAA